MASRNQSRQSRYHPPPPYQTFAPASVPPTRAAPRPAATEQQNNRQYGSASYTEETLLIVKSDSERYQELQQQFSALVGVLLIAVIASAIFLLRHFQLDSDIEAKHQQQLQDMRGWVDGMMLLIDAREDAVQRAEERIGLDLERMREANLYWDQPSAQGHACSAWKTRAYSAKLHNIPGEVSGVNWCQKTPIDIPGFKFAQPEYCEERNNGDVLGHWTLHDDKDCHTYWGRYNNLGCQDGLPGNRLIEMQLLDHHPPWNTGKQLCATTPWGDNGEFPMICENRGGRGIWGKWLVPDETCSQSRHVSEEGLLVEAE
ncbi:hypothetical protein CYLTODRAFT_235192 [Cylindrobasidium torrendii FP15055 ss-10]|uniref:Uncharacterized protein n=1 Tax=Cylindrobasidium torrendii FP15055 ss-10 TaxID=1314674 RepID=A0A0D7BFD0_9AGAR|nr:hypothetical protein CYLTODRAFT_235192 [Cylindrobasidium torrendii FP15055 ss-10]